jgi:myo-inositol catabolism protein IolC
MDLLILPFDHRSSFSKKILGIEGVPNEDQVKEIVRLKGLVYKAFLKVRETDGRPEELGILVDEQYGKAILDDANSRNITTAVGVEKSGQEMFDFEYGSEFGAHIEDVNPNYVKVLVRYNPENKKINKKQLKTLKKLNKFCQKNDRKMLFELLVPPTEGDLAANEDFETAIRPRKTAAAIKEIRKKVKPAVWKLEGLSHEGWELVLENIPGDEKVIVLGRGEDPEKVRFWLKEATGFDQVIGFAVGRTIFMQPLLKHLEGTADEEQTVSMVADNYRQLVSVWRDARN